MVQLIFSKLVRLSLSPKPNWPYLLNPQPFNIAFDDDPVPFLHIKNEWFNAVKISKTFFVANLLGYNGGIFFEALGFIPVWPLSWFPQAYKLFPERTKVWFAPQTTFEIRWFLKYLKVSICSGDLIGSANLPLLSYNY